MMDEHLKEKEKELEMLQATFDEYVTSSSEIETELEQSLTRAETRIQTLSYSLEEQKDKLSALQSQYGQQCHDLEQKYAHVNDIMAEQEQLRQAHQRLEHEVESLQQKIRILETSETDLTAQLEASIEERVFLKDDLADFQDQEQVKEEHLRRQVIELQQELESKTTIPKLPSTGNMLEDQSSLYERNMTLLHQLQQATGYVLVVGDCTSCFLASDTQADTLDIRSATHLRMRDSNFYFDWIMQPRPNDSEDNPDTQQRVQVRHSFRPYIEEFSSGLCVITCGGTTPSRFIQHFIQAIGRQFFDTEHDNISNTPSFDLSIMDHGSSRETRQEDNHPSCSEYVVESMDVLQSIFQSHENHHDHRHAPGHRIHLIQMQTRVLYFVQMFGVVGSNIQIPTPSCTRTKLFQLLRQSYPMNGSNVTQLLLDGLIEDAPFILHIPLTDSAYTKQQQQVNNAPPLVWKTPASAIFRQKIISLQKECYHASSASKHGHDKNQCVVSSHDHLYHVDPLLNEYEMQA